MEISLLKTPVFLCCSYKNLRHEKQKIVRFFKCLHCDVNIFYNRRSHKSVKKLVRKMNS